MRSLTLIIAVLIAAAGLFQSTAQAQPRTANDLQALESLSDSFEALSDRVTPAIVQIISTGYTADPRPTAGAANLLTKQR
ncbi:hypothetical protein GF420_16060, partial [candidate division GN15 bacterium]|nr:hypothetical protein [candidate division GN15 bacterium]